VNGSWVQTGEVVQVDGRAEVSGHCTTQLIFGNPAICQPNGQYDRTVNNIALKYFQPGNTFEFSMGQIFGKNPQTGGTPWYTQLLDSTDTAGSTGPKTYSSYLFGEHKINAQMFVNTTPCNITPGTSSKFTANYYLVPCLPNFNDNNGQITHLPETENPKIKIYGPDPLAHPELYTAVGHAMGYWRAKLSGWGIHIDFQQGPCAEADMGLCIRVAWETPLVNSIACAEQVNVHTDPNTGVVNTSPYIRVRPNVWSQAYLDFLMTHELGHLLGLDSPSCTNDKTVMWEAQSQCGAFPQGAYATQPTDSDGIESAKGAYGSASVATCPIRVQ